MKISDNGWVLIFVAIVVGIVAINILSLYWTHLWISIGVIIFVVVLMFPLFSYKKDIEIESLYSECHGLYEEIEQMKKRKLKKDRKTR